MEGMASCKSHGNFKQPVHFQAMSSLIEQMQCINLEGMKFYLH